MKVILLKDVPGLGDRGTPVSVSDGYARNYLLPRRLARVLDDGAARSFQAEEARKKKRETRLLESARAAAEALSGAVVTVVAKAGESGRLYGSVTTQDIAEAVSREKGMKVDRRSMSLPEPIKALGAYPVRIRLHPQVAAEFLVRVISEGE